ncbi:MAG: hypothetical protein NTW21_43985 [Verrucomicrobia bacterium]|nr:hypothetical protein [Verrucomicrobiota bacterium]
MYREPITTLASVDASAVPESATLIYANGFETGVSDWDDYGGAFNATRVASGTNGIVSAAGGFHAESSPSGSASRWGGYNFGAGAAVPTAFQEYTTSVAIYLNVTGGWANRTRFDFSSAINRADGNFWRDFVFHAGFHTAADHKGPGAGTKRFVISASNHSQPGDANAKNPDQGSIAIATTGWYTFEHHFYDNAGWLAVAMSIFDASRALVNTWTLRTAEPISAIGGNCYGWFALNQFSTLAFDNAELRTHAERGKPAGAHHRFFPALRSQCVAR